MTTLYLTAHPITIALVPVDAKPVQKTISSAGELVLGPFAVAVVDSVTLV